MKRRTRRINHTHRSRIDRERVQLRVFAEANKVFISAQVDLDGLKIEADAKVFLDVSRKAQSERFLLGTASSPEALENVQTGFDDPIGLRYDVVVVGAEDALLLAAARRVRPENSDQQESLLPIRPASDLGELVWRLDLADQPVLEVNERIVRWRELADSPLFQSLVLPQVIAQLMAELIDQGTLEDSGDDEALAEWVGFIEDLGIDLNSLSSESPAEVRRAAIDEVVEAFAARHGFATRLASDVQWGGE